MASIPNIKSCLHCNRPLHGRADKKYCDDACRNNYNNMQKHLVDCYAHIQIINKQLLRNRKILASLIPTDLATATISRDKLLKMGFVFAYHTHMFTNSKGSVYYYCYDFGYLSLENNWYLLVRKKAG